MIRLQRIRCPKQIELSQHTLTEMLSPVIREIQIASIDAVHVHQDRLFIQDDEVTEAPKILHHTDLECPMVVDFPTEETIYRVVIFGDTPADYGLPREDVITLWDLLHQVSKVYDQTRFINPNSRLTPLERLVRYGAFLDIVCTNPLNSPVESEVNEFMRFVAYTMTGIVNTLDRSFSEKPMLSLSALERKVFDADSLTINGKDLFLLDNRVLSLSPILSTQYSRLYMPSLWEAQTAEGNVFAVFTLTPTDKHRLQPWLPKRLPVLTFDRFVSWWTSGANILSIERILTGNYEGLRSNKEALNQQSLQALSAWHQNVLCHYAHMVRLRFETESIDA